MYTLTHALIEKSPKNPNNFLQKSIVLTSADLASSSGQLAPASLNGLSSFGEGLARPECVLATASGDLFTADWRGGVVHMSPNGAQHLYTGHPIDGEALRPNGIALLADGSFLLAHLGAENGGVFRLFRDGRTEPFLRTVQGVDLPPTNFVMEDTAGRVWITVSTRLTPRNLGYRPGCNDGFIIMVDHKGARIVADGLGYTNECALHPSGKWLYVNETFSRKLSRFAIHADGELGPKEVVTEFGAGTFPDGLAFDVEGNAWVVSIVSNRVIRVAADGAQHLWLEDADPAHLAWVEAAYLANELGRPHLDTVKSTTLKNISSLAFGGPDLRTGYLGCLLGSSISHLRMPVAGHPLPHWNYPSSP
jgi:sugar lactone lactonase YvrE